MTKEQAIREFEEWWSEVRPAHIYPEWNALCAAEKRGAMMAWLEQQKKIEKLKEGLRNLWTKIFLLRNFKNSWRKQERD